MRAVSFIASSNHCFEFNLTGSCGFGLHRERAGLQLILFVSEWSQHLVSRHFPVRENNQADLCKLAYQL